MLEVGKFCLISTEEDIVGSGIPLLLLPTEGRFYGQGWRSDTHHFLLELEKWVKPGMTVLDFGCGTGILAIAAAKLGGVVTAVENDPIVAESAREHVALNIVEVTLVATAPDKTFDIVVANMGNELDDFLPQLRHTLKKNGVALWRV